MFCPNCGREILNNADVCLGCGVSLDKLMKKDEGKVSAGWWWLGFFFPYVGLFVWIFSLDSAPKKAKKCGWGALFGTIIPAVLTVLFYVVCFVIFIISETQTVIL